MHRPFALIAAPLVLLAGGFDPAELALSTTRRSA